MAKAERYVFPDTGFTADPLAARNVSPTTGERLRPAGGIGSAKNRATFPTDAQERKELPVFSGFLAYFPDAILAAAAVSFEGNKQHNPGQPLHWDRSKSTDELDTAIRHLMDEQKWDGKVRHKAKALWRIAADLQKEMEADGLGPVKR